MILVRHGESEFNAVFNRTRIDPKIEDPKLTAHGCEQVRRAAAEIRRHSQPIRRLITSPYTRALETAAILAEELSLPVAVEPIVHEHACWVRARKTRGETPVSRTHSRVRCGWSA